MELLGIYLQLTLLTQLVKETANNALVCLLRSLLLTTCFVIVQTSSTICFLTEYPEDRKNRFMRSSTTSVGLHFHEGVEKINENDENTKIENYMGTKSMAGKTSRTCTVGAKIKKKI